MGKIFYLMGKSASGKDTIFKELKNRMSKLKTITLYTTRPIREGETDGVEYHFVDEKKLSEMEANHQVIEMRAYNTKYGIWKYFTANDGQIDLDNQDYLVIGTLASYEEMRQYFGKDKIIPLYIEVADGLRLTRALERENQQTEPKYAELCRRFLADNDDFSEENLERAGVAIRFCNQELEGCIENIIRYIEAEVM